MFARKIARSVRLRSLRLAAGVLEFFIVSRLLRRVRTLAELRDDPECTFFMEFGTAESIECRPPELADSPLPELLAENLGTQHRHAPGIGVIRNVELTGFHSGRFRPVGRLNDGRLLEESTHAKRFIDHEIRWPFHPRDLLRVWRSVRIDPCTPPKRFGLACTCAFPFHIPNYYHWMVQTLPRLWGLEQYIISTGRRPTILLSPQPPAWLIESLAALGYTDADLDFFGEEGALVNELLTLPFMEQDRFLSPNANRWLTKKLHDWRDRQTSNAEHSAPLVYVTRRNQDSRPILNEEALIDALESIGFLCVDAESCTLGTKLDLFRDTRVLIGAHGAGLVNMMFCRRTSVMELFPGRIVTSNYFTLANCLGHRYTYVMCEADAQLNTSAPIDSVLARARALVEHPTQG